MKVEASLMVQYAATKAQSTSRSDPLKMSIDIIVSSVLAVTRGGTVAGRKNKTTPFPPAPQVVVYVFLRSYVHHVSLSPGLFLVLVDASFF